MTKKRTRDVKWFNVCTTKVIQDKDGNWVIPKDGYALRGWFPTFKIARDEALRISKSEQILTQIGNGKYGVWDSSEGPLFDKYEKYEDGEKYEDE